MDFWATIEIGWLTIDWTGGGPVPAWGVLRMWSGVLGPGEAQMAVARRVWARLVAERERVGQPRPGADHGER